MKKTTIVFLAFGLCIPAGAITSIRPLNSKIRPPAVRQVVDNKDLQRKEQEENDRLARERKEREDRERKDREDRERKEQEDHDRKDREDRERKEREEDSKHEDERKFGCQSKRRCKNENFCVIEGMPLYRQASTELFSYINAKENLNITKDPGYCGMGASAMAFKALNNFVAKDKADSTFLDSNDGNEVSYYSGRLVGVNFKNGMTTNLQIMNGFYNVAAKLKSIAKKSERDEHSKIIEGSPYINTKLDLSFSQSGKNGFICKKQIGLLVALSKTAVYNGSAKIAHAMTVNGIENGKVKIFDPWGRIYNVNLTNSTMTHASGEIGYIGSVKEADILNFISFDNY